VFLLANLCILGSYFTCTLILRRRRLANLSILVGEPNHENRWKRNKIEEKSFVTKCQCCGSINISFGFGSADLPSAGSGSYLEILMVIKKLTLSNM
jgi:hypothetical protein